MKFSGTVQIPMNFLSINKFRYWYPSTSSNGRFLKDLRLLPMSASSFAQEGVSRTYAKFRGLAGIRIQTVDAWVVALARAWPHQGSLWHGVDRLAGFLIECTQKTEELIERQVRAILFNVSQALDTGQAAKASEIIHFIDKTEA
jgi:hypothetical protein